LAQIIPAGFRQQKDFLHFPRLCCRGCQPPERHSLVPLVWQKILACSPHEQGVACSRERIGLDKARPVRPQWENPWTQQVTFLIQGIYRGCGVGDLPSEEEMHQVDTG